MIGQIFNTLLYQPLFNFLIFIYLIFPFKDFGITIIVLTVLIRLLLYPISLKALKSQKALSKIQPKVKELQDKYKNDKEKQATEVMALYKSEKINPFSGFLSLLIQLPILIALYWVFQKEIDGSQMNLLYSFIPKPESINYTFLGIVDLLKPNVFFAVLAGVAQFWQAKISFPKTKKSGQGDFAKAMEKQAIYVMPIFTIIILLKLTSAIGLYWTTSTLFTIFQQYILKKHEGQN